MNLYNSSPEQFKRLYELIVPKSIIAVFVYHDMRKEDIKKEIDLKIRLCKKYGVPFMHIHGIGKNNTKKIKEILAEEKVYFSYYQKSIFEDGDKGIIAVELLLSNQPPTDLDKEKDEPTES
jgi:tRNA(Ile)-lysidine synthase TilS/MesJ